MRALCYLCKWSSFIPALFVMGKRDEHTRAHTPLKSEMLKKKILVVYQGSANPALAFGFFFFKPES